MVDLLQSCWCSCWDGLRILLRFNLQFTFIKNVYISIFLFWKFWPISVKRWKPVWSRAWSLVRIITFSINFSASNGNSVKATFYLDVQNYIGNSTNLIDKLTNAVVNNTFGKFEVDTTTFRAILRIVGKFRLFRSVGLSPRAGGTGLAKYMYKFASTWRWPI